MTGSNASDSMLRTIWLQRLPKRTQEILVILDGVDLDKLADCADKATERARATLGTAAVTDDWRHQIEQRLEELALVGTQKLGRPSSARPRFRDRSKSPRRGRANSGERQKICYYHRKFGDKAWRCILPCESKFPLAKPEN